MIEQVFLPITTSYTEYERQTEPQNVQKRQQETSRAIDYALEALDRLQNDGFAISSSIEVRLKTGSAIHYLLWKHDPIQTVDKRGDMEQVELVLAGADHVIRDAQGVYFLYRQGVPLENGGLSIVLRSHPGYEYVSAQLQQFWRFHETLRIGDEYRRKSASHVEAAPRLENVVQIVIAVSAENAYYLYTNDDDGDKQLLRVVRMGDPSYLLIAEELEMLWMFDQNRLMGTQYRRKPLPNL